MSKGKFLFGVQYLCDFSHAGKPFTSKDPCLVRVGATDENEAKTLGNEVMSARFPNVRRRFQRVIRTGFRLV